ncbi:expressed unknown protein [Seminavis robusta]|uniref:F-box domain-containing protein n=1 Tax=Seminavis robusta TaxID=568900 RepID=A0A9N8D887_9STRA|nr:expressed unknown protein [Seminavis robusta]|eukprot:Sro28_g018610.1 n/a (272) ;mRNA; f:43944-44773
MLTLLVSEAPQEIVSSILAFAGPHSALVTMARVNKAWRRAAHHEATYRALCLALNKHRVLHPYDQPHPHPHPHQGTCWRSLFQEHILVPDDCSTLTQAMRLASHLFNREMGIKRNRKPITVWIRPGTHSVNQPVLVALPEQACLRIKTLPPFTNAHGVGPHLQDPMEVDPSQPQAVLIMDTRLCNSHSFTFNKGSITLQHYSRVQVSLLLKQKNQNAAIFIQQKIAPTPSAPPPHCLLDNVSITSISGKGIINRSQGGQVTISDSYVARLW